MTPDTTTASAGMNISQNEGNCVLSISGRLDADAALFLFKKAPEKLSEQGLKDSLILDLSGLDYLDTAGAVFLERLERMAQDAGFSQIRLEGLSQEYARLMELVKKTKKSDIEQGQPKPLSFIENRGQSLSDFLSDTKEFITYIGEITWALGVSLRHPTSIRWADTFLIAERSGVDALGIVALISFIVGLVMAFQAAIPMRMFGAELYVANLIGIAMVRELGPLMTAIVLAGRSASAFAAEIGTMRINEEIDALTVMGLDPVRFLIVPRVIASTVVTPLLTIFSNLVGILGGALVITSMGYPVIAYYNQIASFVTWNDFAGGLVKCFVFGILIAATGCIRGYQTQSGPSAVGVSTTRAVVTGIILIAVFDGIFSIIYYYLGI